MTVVLINSLKLINKIVVLIIKKINYLINLLSFKINRIEYPIFPKINGRVFIKNKGTMQFGENVVINSDMKSNPIGGDNKTILICTEGAKLIIGNNTGISNSCIYARNKIRIGDNVFIGGGCKIYDTDFHSLDHRKRRLNEAETEVVVKPVNIKDNVFIGAHSIILKGVTIEECSVVGAGSVVTKNIPPNEVWAGNPARFIRKIQII